MECYQFTKKKMEGVLFDPNTDYNNISKTQNGRVSYPIYHIDNYHKPQMGGHPENIIFLTCDAFGILPPVAKLSHEQAMYHFISGYTSKVAGTELGIDEPEATFSACFGAAFLTLHPTRYANILIKKLKQHNSNVYLVNTGWTGGKYGEGERISIKNTRSCIDAILNSKIKSCHFKKDPVFNFEYPINIPNIPKKICDPKLSWEDKKDYDKQRLKIARLFIENYEKFKDGEVTDYSSYGPKVISNINNW